MLFFKFMMVAEHLQQLKYRVMLGLTNIVPAFDQALRSTKQHRFAVNESFIAIGNEIGSWLNSAFSDPNC